MNSIRHLILSITFLIGIIMFGTVGYALMEKWSIMDALYMTIITISTVGYQEVHAISGFGRIFTIILVIVGVGLTLYAGGTIVQFMLEGHLRMILGRKRVDKKISRLRNHYIICGYGRIGRVIYQNLKNKTEKLAVLENGEEMATLLEEDHILHLIGDATDESNLLKIGVLKAKMLVAALGTDADNVFLVLTARELNSTLHIVARASNHRAAGKLLTAGANRVESPYEIGAAAMAHRILKPTVTSFLDLAFKQECKDIQMEEIAVSATSPLANMILKDSGIRQKFNLILIAIKKPDGSMLFNPSFETVLEPNDMVIAVGGESNLQNLGKILSA